MAKLTKEEIFARKEEIAERYIKTPLIYFMVRAWLFSWRARIFMVLAVLGLIAVAVSVPKIWQVTPEEVRPVIKISVLDELKAMALERNARRYMAAGREDYGLMAFNAAIGNNEGNARRIREFLRMMIQRQNAREELPLDTLTWHGLQRADWLTRLSQEPEDLELALEYFEAMEFNEDLLGYAGLEEKDLSDGSKKLALKALLREGHAGQFEEYWKKWAPADGWADDLEMQLYRAAATAAYGAAEKAPEARAFLEKHLDGEKKLTASRLYLILCYERQNDAEYTRVFERLKTWRQDRLIDHAHYWRLLAAVGKKEEALRLADQFNRAPRTAMETSQLAAVYYDLEMKDEARALLDQYIQRFGFYERLWVQQGRILAAMKEWVHLRNLIAKMRLDPTIAHRMTGYSYYLEGRAEMGEGRTAAAHELFQRIPEHGIPNLQVAFVVIEEMRDEGHLDVAARLLEQIESEARDIPRYWMFVVQLADEMKNIELLRKATGEFLRLRPDDPAAKSNHAAALLAERNDPTGAIKLTFELLSGEPENIAFQINHASALAQNKRFSDAEKALEEVDLDRIKEPEVKTMYYFTLVEALTGQGKLARAGAAAERVEERYLFPGQAAEFAKWRETIEGDGAPKAAASSTN